MKLMSRKSSRPFFIQFIYSYYVDDMKYYYLNALANGRTLICCMDNGYFSLFLSLRIIRRIMMDVCRVRALRNA